jgi:hypothetical protein
MSGASETAAMNSSTFTDMGLRGRSAAAAYEDWYAACVAVDDAYERWVRATTGETRMAFWAYRAALNGEEQAAQAYSVRLADTARPGTRRRPST